MHQLNRQSRLQMGAGLVAAAALALVATPAAASEPPPPPVVNGTVTSDYEYVGVLLACTSRYCQDFCSSSLVSNTWVVTAAHCVEALDEFASAGYTDFYVGFGRDVNSLTDWAEMDRWIEHPSYDPSRLTADIGLIELASSVTSITPVAVNSDSPSTFTVGSATYVGYGITDDGRSDSGTKRYANIPLDSYDSQFIIAYDSTETYNVCSGDSGGAGLIPLTSTTYELIAVNSYVAPTSTSDGYCDGGYTGGTRTDVFYSWMDGYVGFSSSGTSGSGSSGSGSSGSGSSGSGSSGSGSSGSGSSGSGGSGSGSGGGSGDSGGDTSGSGSGGDGGVDTGDFDDTGVDGASDSLDWGETEAEPGEAPGKGTGCSTVSSAAAPAAMLAWLGAMAVARRRED